MRFSFNALLLAEYSTGMRTLIVGVLSGLRSLVPSEEWVVYIRPKIQTRIDLPRWDGCHYVQVPLAKSLPGRLMTELWFLPSLDRRHAVDVSYNPVAYLPLNQKIPAVVTFVDFTGSRVPAGYTLGQRLSHGLRYKHALFHARGIATISETMNRDLLATYGQQLKAVVAPILCGVGPEFFQPPMIPASDLDRRYGLHGNVLLASGGTNARKDIQTLARSFAILPGQIVDAMTVVVMGPSRPREVARILELIPVERRHRFRIIGFVPQRDVLELTAKARLMAFPTLDEGFGLPVLEAMAAGKPVICSDLDVLREVGGDCVRYFPVQDYTALAQSIEELWTTDVQCRRMSVTGQERARLFTWDAVAERLMELLRSVGNDASDGRK